MEDANGWKVWGELNIDVEQGIQTITIPQDFIDKAVYPIRHATGEIFGNTNIGGSTSFIATRFSDESITIGTNSNLAVPGTLDSISAATKMQTGPDNVDLFIAIYREDSAGTGSHGLVASVEQLNQAHTTTATFKTLTASSEVLTADVYILSALGNGVDCSSADGDLFLMHDFTGSTNFYSEGSTGAGSYATRKAENPWTESASAGSRVESIYATYTPSATPTPEPAVPVGADDFLMLSY